jgi:hypothetical protein
MGCASIYSLLLQTSYTFLVPEDVDLNTTLGTLTAVDRDEDINGEILFEIVSGDTDRFELVSMQVDAMQTYSAMIINNQVRSIYENDDHMLHRSDMYIHSMPLSIE